jgi:hypothetical protein
MFQLNYKATDVSKTAPSSGLSRSSKIAIGTVVPIVVLVACAILGLLLFRRRRRRSKSPSQAIDYDKPELDVTSPGVSYREEPSELPAADRVQEKQSKEIHELFAHDAAHELGVQDS